MLGKKSQKWKGQNMEISQQLKNILFRKGMTQKKLASMSGVTERTVARVLRGRREGNIDTLLRFADVLNYEVVLIPKKDRGAIND